MISQQTITQILSRLDIVEVIGGFVRLKKRGVNYLGLCPFHNEKTPSFTVSPSKEIFKCFGCGKSGNTIGFLMEHEKFSYAEALRWLAAKYQVEIEETGVSPEMTAKAQTAESLYIINAFAQQFFAQQLFEHPDGRAIALAYLSERGYDEATIRKFGIGYCPPERDLFARTAIKARYNPEYLLQTGLVVRREDQLIDNYRGRIIFPVHNLSGKIVGFGARMIGNTDKGPKYINTPENEVYVKSRLLYGSYFARQAIDKYDECLLVEGYTDVLALHQAGIEHVVASGGTSLTPEQLRLVKKFTRNLTIVYDGDAAGVKAARRGLDLALEEGLDVRLVMIPGNDDPDSYLKKIGAAAFREFIRENRRDFILFQLGQSLRESGDDPSRKSAAVNDIAETIARISKAEDFSRQQDYIRQAAAMLRVSEEGLHHLVNRHIRDRVSRQESREPVPEATAQPKASGGPADEEALSLLQKDEQHERAIVRCLIEFGTEPWDEGSRVADYILREFHHPHMVEDPVLSAIMEQYKDWYDNGLNPGPREFLYHPDQTISSAVVSLFEFPYELSPNWKDHYEGKIATREELYREEIESTSRYLRLRKIRRMIAENQKDLEKPVSPEEQQVVISTHQHLKQLEKEILGQMGTVILK